MYTTTTKSRENMYPKNVLGRYEVIPKNSVPDKSFCPPIPIFDFVVATTFCYLECKAMIDHSRSIGN